MTRGPRAVRLATILTAIVFTLAACSSGGGEPGTPFDIDGTYQVTSTITQSDDPSFPKGASATTYVTVSASLTTATVNFEDGGVLDAERNGNTVRHVGPFNGCDSTLTLRWSSAVTVSGTLRDDCLGSVVRASLVGERTTQ